MIAAGTANVEAQWKTKPKVVGFHRVFILFACFLPIILKCNCLVAVCKALTQVLVGTDNGLQLESSKLIINNRLEAGGLSSHYHY